MADLLDQPPEILHRIFQSVAPVDLASLSRSCRQLHAFVESDDHLWKKQYLRIFDLPSTKDIEHATDWKYRVKRVVSTKKILESENVQIKSENLEQVLEDCIQLVTASATNGARNVSYVATQFRSAANVSSFLCRSSLFHHSRYPTDSPAATEELRQLSAKLHVFSGLNVEPTPDAINATLARRVHPFARSRVYDLRRYTDNTFWGPFMDDGSGNPDWEKVQAIMVDIYYNLRQHPRRPSPRDSATGATEIFTKPFYGLAPNSYQSAKLSGTVAPKAPSELDLQDPYGVTGTWMRIVCFLDHMDLFRFNFQSEPIPADLERPPISTREAFRLIKLSIRVSKIDPPGPNDHPDFPVVHFSGKSRSQFASWDPNANSRIRGVVRTLPTNPPTIRWTTFSIFHGEERWRSEGIQLGGPPVPIPPPQSTDKRTFADGVDSPKRPTLLTGRGVLGNWFDKDYDPHGPAGPTCFWKISDDIHDEGEMGWHALHLHNGPQQGIFQLGQQHHQDVGTNTVGVGVERGGGGGGGNGNAANAGNAGGTGPGTGALVDVQIHGMTHPITVPLAHANTILNLNLVIGALAAQADAIADTMNNDDSDSDSADSEPEHHHHYHHHHHHDDDQHGDSSSSGSSHGENDEGDDEGEGEDDDDDDDDNDDDDDGVDSSDENEGETIINIPGNGSMTILQALSLIFQPPGIIHLDPDDAGAGAGAGNDDDGNGN